MRPPDPFPDGMLGPCCEEGAPCIALAYEGPALDDRERAVVEEIGRDCDGWIAFQGLRRRLGLHQQSLARTLRRLARYGLVAKGSAGYKLTDQGCAAIAGRVSPRPAGPAVTVVHALLPAHLPADDVAARLAHRWFRGLRWFGLSEGPGETALTWTAERGTTVVRVRIHGGALTVEVEPVGDADAALPAAAPILASVAELYASRPDAKAIRFGAT